MEEYTVPELLRVNLTNTILNLKAMGIHDVLNFEFMEVPDENQLLDGLKQLFYLSAIDENGRITKLG
jgi:ATP-dependent RNA helicase DHX8/PRP22